MKIESLFTDYDDSIEANAFRDLMGLQIIWPAVGLNIFGRIVITFSNDIQNFTLNLFNHYLVIAVKTTVMFLKQRISYQSSIRPESTTYKEISSEGTQKNSKRVYLDSKA